MAKRSKKPTEIVNHTVSFNILDPDQYADHEYALQRTNFSGYVKWLIRLDRLRTQGVQFGYVQPPAPEEKSGGVVDDSVESFT